MTKKPCAFVRNGNAPIMQISKRPGCITLVGVSHRHSWQPRTEDDALFDEMMAGSMQLDIDSTAVAIKHVPSEDDHSENLLVVGITKSSSHNGMREAEMLCGLLKNAKRSGWRCIAVCLDTSYLKSLECVALIDVVVCRSAKKPWTTKRDISIPICPTDDVTAALPGILRTACNAPA